MPYTIKRVEKWAGAIEDRPGGLAEKLEALAKAGANLEYMLARRKGDKPGSGELFLAPLKGARQTAAAQAAGLHRAGSALTLRIEGPDRAGLCARIASALAAAGINLKGAAAVGAGKRSVLYLSFDNKDDVAKSGRILKRVLAAAK